MDVFATAYTARIKVYEGDIATIVDDEPQMNDVAYATGYFYTR